MKRLIRKKLAWGVIVIVMSQMLGMLPTADFLPPIYLKIICFMLGILLSVAKGVEMFFDQSAQLEESVETTTKTTVTTLPKEPKP